jgi:hypothetical protein
MKELGEHAQEGTGLGLPLVKMLVEKHGGALTVTSAPGEGTIASFTIPGWRIEASTRCASALTSFLTVSVSQAFRAGQPVTQVTQSIFTNIYG